MLGSLVAALFSPIEVAGVLFVLESQSVGSRMALGSVLHRASCRWVRVFLGEQIAGLFIVLRTILLIVPGVLLALRFSLVTTSAALEGRWPFEAMRRSTDLTRGRRRQILYSVGTVFLYMFYIEGRRRVTEAGVPDVAGVEPAA